MYKRKFKHITRHAKYFLLRSIMKHAILKVVYKYAVFTHMPFSIIMATLAQLKTPVLPKRFLSTIVSINFETKI